MGRYKKLVSDRIRILSAENIKLNKILKEIMEETAQFYKTNEGFLRKEVVQAMAQVSEFQEKGADAKGLYKVHLNTVVSLAKAIDAQNALATKIFSLSSHPRLPLGGPHLPTVEG